MKKQSPYRKMSACLAAAALTWLGSLPAAQAAAPALTGFLHLRPLTHTEIAKYDTNSGPAWQFSGGLTTVGLGEPAYLEALANLSLNPANITNVTWTLVSKPAGSSAVIAPSPLGNNVPIYYQADAAIYQIAGRALLRPDVVGNYVVNLNLAAAGSGSTNVNINITGATYLGVTACASCHSGYFPTIASIYPTYTNTPHASFFTLAIQGLESSHYNSSCIQCHVVGFDTNSLTADNGGFNDVAQELGWTFPATLTATNWSGMPSDLQDLSNIQCENCHGPGSEHVRYTGGLPANTNAIAVSFDAGACSQCHDDLPTHYYSAEWNNSLHANMTRTPSGSASRIACVRCHTAAGFIGYVANLNTNVPYTTNYAYVPLTCQGCHDPHDASNPHQLRTSTVVALSDGQVFTNAGAGGFCFNCHTSRNGSVTNSLVGYPALAVTWNGGNAFGTHDSPQADMLEGVNAVTYGQTIASAPHASVVTNTCVGCHMQTIASTDPAFTLAGGHTTKMSYNVVTNGVTNVVAVAYVCAQCHGAVTNFNILVPDYVGYGYSQGIQTQVQILLNQLSTLLPPSGYQANANNYVADGKVKSPSSQTNWPAKFLQAAYNYQFVSNDGSLGVHNGPFAVGLLKASIANLTGISTPGGLPDAWNVEYFGPNFATNAASNPNAINNPAGLPNWLMYALGLNPLTTTSIKGSGGGTIYFNGNDIVNGTTNTVAIYTAAEIAFNTVVGETYQIQGITALTGGWQNISTNIPGTGASVSFVTPTRGNAQWFFRVLQTP
jgi:nitrate reductase cytochrome c-type subunit